MIAIQRHGSFVTQAWPVGRTSRSQIRAGHARPKRLPALGADIGRDDKLRVRGPGFPWTGQLHKRGVAHRQAQKGWCERMGRTRTDSNPIRHVACSELHSRQPQRMRPGGVPLLVCPLDGSCRVQRVILRPPPPHGLEAGTVVVIERPFRWGSK
eukprot:7388817-Prymnesium_polylepis.1